MFATDERQVVRINAGGNSRPDVNGFISPSELRFELWDARSMRAAVQRCAERHLEAGLLEWPTADADGDAELWTGPDGGLYDLGIYESGRIGRKPLD